LAHTLQNTLKPEKDQLKTPLRGSGDTFAIALKGSFNNLLAVRGSFAQDTGDVEQNTATVR